MEIKLKLKFPLFYNSYEMLLQAIFLYSVNIIFNWKSSILSVLLWLSY